MLAKQLKDQISTECSIKETSDPGLYLTKESEGATALLQNGWVTAQGIMISAPESSLCLRGDMAFSLRSDAVVLKTRPREICRLIRGHERGFSAEEGSQKLAEDQRVSGKKSDDLHDPH